MTLWLKGCNTGTVSKSFPNWNCPRPTNPLQKHNNLETWTLSILQSTLLLIICLLFSLRPNIFDCLHWTCFEIEKKSLSFSKFYRSSTVGSSAKFPTCPTFPTTLTHKKQKCLNANFFFRYEPWLLQFGKEMCERFSYIFQSFSWCRKCALSNQVTNGIE